MVVNRALANEEICRDFLIGMPFDQEMQDLNFAWREQIKS